MRKFCIAILLTVLILPVNISALEIKTADTLGLDKTIFKDAYSTGLPEKILVVPIFMPSNARLTEETWLKGIYYYTVQRLGYPTLPYHYIINNKGVVYGSESSDERILNIKDLGDHNIVIGYLAPSNATNFSAEAGTPLGDLILDIANRNSISIDNVKVAGLKFTRESETNLVYLEQSPIFGLWETGLNQIIESIRPRYSPKVREYGIEIENVTLASTELVVGDEVEGTARIKNIGPNNIYITDSTYLLAEKSDGSNSLFYLNNVWVSQSQFPAVIDEQTFRIDQSVEFNFKVKAPLAVGEVSEKFKIKLVGDGQMDTGEFEIKVNVQRGDKRIVQINETETNFLRVRAEPSTVSEEISRVDSGGRYIVLEEDPNGFLKIDLGDGRSGWVAGWLTTTI